MKAGEYQILEPGKRAGFKYVYAAMDEMNDSTM